MTAPVVAFFPEASFGAALNCVGIAQQLKRSGAVPVFLCHAGFTGIFAEYGFKEYHMPETDQFTQQAEENWQTFISTHLEHFNQPPMEQLKSYVAPTWEAIVDTAMQAEAGLEALLKRIKPDAIVLDNVIMFPAITKAGVPWIRVVSCAETELPDPNVPAYLSGMTTNDPNRQAFETAYFDATAPAHKRYNKFRQSCGLVPLPDGQFLEASSHLNLLLAPSIIRHDRHRVLPQDKFEFLEGCVREETRFELPELPVNEGPLIYLSFGSLGAIDTDLIGRMINVFADIRARFLVNVGGFLEHYQNVPDNVFLGSWFPQPSVVKQADLFIHHGGNNSFCEALYHGVPSLIMPYCWDGHDNAARAVETGTGARLAREDWTPDVLGRAISNLVKDQDMRARLKRNSAHMISNSGTMLAADRIMHTLRSPDHIVDSVRTALTVPPHA